MLDAIARIFLMLTLLFMSSQCQRIECDWSYEFICGDKCVLQENSCFCGRDIILYKDTAFHVCCNTDACFKDMIDGSVHCNNGVKQTWRQPCNGVCKQAANYGLTTVPCENGKQCVEEAALCRGSPLCTE